MRFTNYGKYSGNLADALNLQALLDQLGDFLLQSGFAGGPHYHPYWGMFDDADRSLDALKQALLEALINSGQLTPEMLAEMRGDGDGDEAARQALADLLDRLIERMQEEGLISLSGGPPQMPDGHTPVGEAAGEGEIDQAREAAANVEFNVTAKGMDFLGYRTLQGLLGALGRSAAGSHDTPYLSTGIEAEAASRPYEFGDTLNLDVAATLKNALARGGLAPTAPWTWTTPTCTCSSRSTARPAPRCSCWTPATP